jgi:hypothetical protein
MTRHSDSDAELEKYMPSVEAMRQMCDHDAAEERIRKALDNPELRALLAEEGRSVDFTPLPPAPTAPRAPAAKASQAAPALPPPSSAPARASTPSPWAKEAPSTRGVDVAALPSTSGPAAAPTGRVPKKGPKPERGVVQATAALVSVDTWSPARRVLTAVAAAFLPAILVIALWKPETVVQYVPMPVSAAPVLPPATATGAAPASAASTVPSSTPTAQPSAQPSTNATSTTQPNTQPTTSATASKPKPPSPVDDPYDAAPNPTMKVAPSAEPTATPAVKPTAEPDPFIDRRPQ